MINLKNSVCQSKMDLITSKIQIHNDFEIKKRKMDFNDFNFDSLTIKKTFEFDIENNTNDSNKKKNNDTIMENIEQSIITKVKSKKTKKIKKRKNLLLNEIQDLKMCQSKVHLEEFLINSSESMKRLLRFYIQECFIFHIFSRKLKNPKHLFSRRSILFQIIRNPSILKTDCSFNNNSISNFCTGACLFLLKHHTSVGNYFSKNFEQLK